MIFDVLSGLLDFVAGVFTGDWNAAWQGIQNAVSAVWNWLTASLAPIDHLFGNLWNGIKNKSIAAWNAIKQAAGALWGSIKAKFQANTVVSYFTGIWNRVKSAFSSIGTKIGSSMASAIKKAINSVIGQIQSKINSGIGVINSVLSVVGGGKISGVNLPRLAQGGYVRANTPQLAMIGDNRRYGEIVAPENKMTEMILTALKLFNQQDQPKKPHNEENQLIELVVNLGDETLMRKIIKLLREEQRRGNYEFSF